MSGPGKDVVRALQKAGFELVRVKGTLRQILVDAGLTVEDLRALL
ncbi:type II toxin-antitoxin system HicA family toxin [Frankia sp. Cr2]|nr:type II toxin-antitoxin system HicA family toxin [Frankia sp. Cr2]